MLRFLSLTIILINVTPSVYSPLFPDINIDDCGWVNEETAESVVGGRPAIIEDHPWICSLQDTVRNHFCGANIITNRWLITAAHCVHKSKHLNVEHLFVLCGRSEQVVALDPNIGQVHGVEKITVHELNTENSDENDIALIKLTSPIEFVVAPGQVHPIPAPICLPSPNALHAGIARVADWGSVVSDPVILMNRLQEIDLQIRDQDVCALIDPKFSPESMICTSSAGIGLDLSPGESGSALVVKNDDRHTLIGLSSYNYHHKGDPVGLYPIVFTKVSHYVEWIQYNIRD